MYNDNHLQKTITASIAMIAIVAILPTTFVYAQTATNTTITSPSLQLVTPSTVAQQIINNTKAECEQAQFLQKRCVTLVYESPTTVVLRGLVSIFGGSPESRGFQPNPFLWNAVDGFKAQGYAINDIEVVMEGNKSSDNEFNVIMSK